MHVFAEKCVLYADTPKHSVYGYLIRGYETHSLLRHLPPQKATLSSTKAPIQNGHQNNTL